MRANEQACSFHGRDSQLSPPLPLSAGVATLYVYMYPSHFATILSKLFSIKFATCLCTDTKDAQACDDYTY